MEIITGISAKYDSTLEATLAFGFDEGLVVTASVHAGITIAARAAISANMPKDFISFILAKTGCKEGDWLRRRK
jgi:hypothetical protein